MTQQGDVKLFQTNDDGNIEVIGGIVTMSSGLDTAAYLSLFGGNIKDDGRDSNPNTWWGNLDETEPAKKYISRTQNIIDGLPASSANLRRLEDAARNDLQWMIDEGAASEIGVIATIPGLNKVAIAVVIIAEGEERSFVFSENWKAAN